MHARYWPWACVCPSVCLSVCVCLTRRIARSLSDSWASCLTHPVYSQSDHVCQSRTAMHHLPDVAAYGALAGWSSLSRLTDCNYIVTIWYDTIRDAILTCARKLTWVSLIYRTETTTKKCKTEKLQSKNEYMLRSNSRSLENPCSQSRRRKGKAAVRRICRKGRF